MSREELIASLREYAFKAGLPEHRSIMLEAVRQLSAPSIEAKFSGVKLPVRVFRDAYHTARYLEDADGKPIRLERLADVLNAADSPVDHG